VVVGLGEALVGNYPGRAMGFVVNKATGEAKVTHLPSKHMGVFLNEDTVRILPPPSSPLLRGTIV